MKRLGSNKRITKFILQIILLPLIVGAPLAASESQNGNQGQGNNKHNQKEHRKNNNEQRQKNNRNQAQLESNKIINLNPNVTLNPNFGDVRPIAIEYGLTGYKGLPPGIAKQIRKGKPLPPGIAKKVLPANFRSHLPVYEGYEWRVSGRDLILVAISTAIVAEIIENVFE
ncbi:MAG: hypothetical protein KA732_20720 [Providencia sp.]|uniref:anti-virulence regulator CigR family protein n=1 Tax=Providencia sp. TaxID=589 RepID=UPI001B753B11|nr:anti-virulence regulator CigR family protein [Providencia sp.]MBP6083668.1 hypothetical protein [Providencia sp.]